MLLPEQLREGYGPLFGQEEEPDLYPCDQPTIKLKVGEYFRKESKGTSDENYQTWLNLQIKLDSFKTVNVRSTTEILDLLGDIGGFNDAVTSIFALAGAFFSSRFVTAALAKDLFMEKKATYHRKHQRERPHKSELSAESAKIANKNEARRQILNNFDEIDISKFQILTDPMMACLCIPFAFCCSCVKGFRRR